MRGVNVTLPNEGAVPKSFQSGMSSFFSSGCRCLDSNSKRERRNLVGESTGDRDCGNGGEPCERVLMVRRMRESCSAVAERPGRRGEEAFNGNTCLK